MKKLLLIIVTGILFFLIGAAAYANDEREPNIKAYEHVNKTLSV